VSRQIVVTVMAAQRRRRTRCPWSGLAGVPRAVSVL